MTRLNSSNPLIEALTFRVNPFPEGDMLDALWRKAWGEGLAENYANAVLPRSLCHVCAYHDERIVGFVNVAWDGGKHAFILDTCVHPDYRRLGVAVRLVVEVVSAARSRGAKWLHVDYEPHLDSFYRQCGFRSTAAGIIDLLQDTPG